MLLHDGEPVIEWLPKIDLPNTSDSFLSRIILRYRLGQPQKIKKIFSVHCNYLGVWAALSAHSGVYLNHVTINYVATSLVELW
jgi:hypothetical protein